jgi:hypothetical protein
MLGIILILPLITAGVKFLNIKNKELIRKENNDLLKKSSTKLFEASYYAGRR